MNTMIARTIRLIILASCLSYCSWALAQSSGTGIASDVSELGNLAIKLNQISEVLHEKQRQQDDLKNTIASGDLSDPQEEKNTLASINLDIIKLGQTFERIALSNIDISKLEESVSVSIDWRTELIDIIKPLIDTMKSVTEKPRLKAQLRQSIESTNEKQLIVDNALAVLQAIPTTDLDVVSTQLLSDLVAKWKVKHEEYNQELLVRQSKLENLTNHDQSFLSGIWPSTRSFLLGRGATLLLAFIAGVATWAVMRFCWWVYNSHLTTKEQRRTQTWYRLLSYSYYLITIFIIIFSVIIVLYAREDVLLLAFAFVLLVGATLGFRQVLPRYVKEVRLLLNLGSVREDECVVYRGLPWQVMSLNLQTVLRNPALDGVIRVPLETMSGLISRPTKETLWFPSQTGDYVILPGGTFAKVKRQTPDLVELLVRGSMSMSFRAVDYYPMNITNLTREGKFCVVSSFGFDYSLQSICLTEIPTTLRSALRQAMLDAGYIKYVDDLLVDFKAAGESSLDYLIVMTLGSELLVDYFRVPRLIQKTCVAVANERGWIIPFPQMTLHQREPIAVQYN